MELKKYLEGKAFYFVDDCFSCDEKDVEYLFLLESPHKEEIKTQVPLSGKSGKAVSKFLFGENEEESFGEKVKNKKTNQKIGIVNISNVPLQIIEIISKTIEIPKELEDIRNSKKENAILYKIFKEKMDKMSFPNIKKIIVCGEFAFTYFNKYNTEERNGEVKWAHDIISVVPHPSRGQWAFILKNEQHLKEIVNLFEKPSE